MYQVPRMIVPVRTWQQPQQRALYSRSRDGLKRMSFSVLWRNIEKKRRVSPVKNSSYNTALDLSGKTPPDGWKTMGAWSKLNNDARLVRLSRIFWIHRANHRHIQGTLTYIDVYMSMGWTNILNESFTNQTKPFHVSSEWTKDLTDETYSKNAFTHSHTHTHTLSLSLSLSLSHTHTRTHTHTHIRSS